MAHMPDWELVHDKPHERIKRFAVPGGWLYLVELFTVEDPVANDKSKSYLCGWHPPVFVPDAPKGSRAV